MLCKPFPDPVLSLASNSIGKLGTLDADSLSCIWTVFAKCAENLENGRRLENLSWRLWYRTALLCHEDTLFYTNVSKSSPTMMHRSSGYLKNKNQDLPELSLSIESVSSLDEHEVKGQVSDNYDASKMSVFVQKHSKRPNTMQYVSPGRFQKMITDLSSLKVETEKWKIDHNKAMLRQSLHKKSISSSPKTNPLHSIPPNDSYLRFNQVSSSSGSNHHSSLATQTAITHPDMTEYGVNNHDDNISEFYINKTSHETPLHPHHSIQKQEPLEKVDKMFFIQETLPSESYIKTPSKNDMTSSTTLESYQSTVKSAKHISFEKSADISSSGTSNSQQLECNTINSVDDGDWDSMYDSSNSSSVNEKPIFQKIDTRLSKLQIHPRPSLLSFMLQNKTDGNLTNSCSKSSPAISLSQTSASFIIPKNIPQNNRHPTTAHIMDLYLPVVSPRTIRRNMFATELSESLRRNLLWERQQRTSTAFRTLKRRHTANDVTKLNDFPIQSSNENHDFFHDVDYSYHVAGW